MSEDSHTSGEATSSAEPVNTREVFISYASQDAPVAKILVEALERHGIPCWIAPRDVVPGSLYADEIVGAINAAKIVVLVLSEHSVASPHVGKEIERASSKRRRIIALHTDSVPLTRAFEYFLSESQWIEVGRGEIEPATAQLVEAVRRQLDPCAVDESHARAAVQTSGTTGTRWQAAGAIAVLSLALGYLAFDKLWMAKRTGEIPLSAVAPATLPAESMIPENSVAVLPFVDMSEKKDQEFFSDGLSEELIDLLTNIPGLQVPARTSSFYFKGKSEDVPTIARRLLVSHILEGSVRRSGKRLRVTAQLIRADNGYHLWSATYDREFKDIFAVQDEIAGAVVKALKVSLLEPQEPRLAPTRSGEAYTLYVKARALGLRGNAADAKTAAEYLQKALEIDPNYAPAWARLAQTRTFQFELQTIPLNLARDQARQAARRALELDPNLGAAHLSMARVHYFFEWDWAAADAEIQRARQLDPGDADALRWAGIIARTLGRVDEAVDLFHKAIDRDPLDGANYAMLGDANLGIGRNSDAEFAYRKALELSPPRGFGAVAALGETLVIIGQPEAAIAQFDRDKDEEARTWGKALAYFALRRKPDADAAIADLETRFGGSDAYDVAEVHAYRGETSAAFDWLDRAYEQRDRNVTTVNSDPLMATLRRDSRLKALLQKLKLPE
jgi:TolB-like protein/Tfp pilus assembly protein PilF